MVSQKNLSKKEGDGAVERLNIEQSITFPLRDVLLESLGRGQFIAAGVLLIVGVFIWRLPEHQLIPLVMLILERCESGAVWGWILFVAFGMCWVCHYQLMTRAHSRQLKREQAARARLQSELFAFMKNNLNE